MTSEPEAMQPTRAAAAAPYVVACALVLLFFAAVESVRPYYFFQDDNRDIFVPLYVHNYRAAADGQLAQFNFFQSLGKPHYATGQAAVLHPIPYISIFLSQVLLGHVFASADILALLYLLLGAAGMVFLVRRLGFSSAAAVFASVCWTVTPFNMLVSQSWTTYPPVIGLLPWMLAGTLLVYRKPTISAASIFIISNLGLIYVGAPQFVLYGGFVEAGVLLLLVAFDLRAGTLDRARALRTLGTFAMLTALVGGLSAALVIPMWKHVQLSAFRSRGMSDAQLRVCSVGPAQFLNGVAAPFGKFYDPSELDLPWCGTNFPPSFTHQGYLATLLLIAYGWRRKHIDAAQRRVLDASLIIGLILLLAMTGLLTPLVSIIPVANRFRWPFKYFAFANMLFALCTVPAFEALRERFSRNGRIAFVAIAIAVQLANLTALDLTFPTQAFFEHTDPVPLREALRERFNGGRIASFGFEGAAKQPTLHTMGYDYATLWQLHYFGGYDPLVPSRNLRFTYGLDYFAIIRMPPEMVAIDYLRFWGVRWYILNRPFDAKYEPVFARQGLRRVHADAHRVVLEDARTRPLVSSNDCTTESLGNLGDDLTAVVRCSRNSEVRLRFLYQPFFSAFVDGAGVPIKALVSSQMMIPVPAGRHEIRLAYDDPYISLGIGISVLTLAAALLLLLIARRRVS